MRSTLFNLFFYGFTFLTALVAYLVARMGRRRALWRLVGFWGRVMLGQSG